MIKLLCEQKLNCTFLFCYLILVAKGSLFLSPIIFWLRNILVSTRALIWGPSHFSSHFPTEGLESQFYFPVKKDYKGVPTKFASLWTLYKRKYTNYSLKKSKNWNMFWGCFCFSFCINVKQKISLFHFISHIFRTFFLFKASFKEGFWHDNL